MVWIIAKHTLLKNLYDYRFVILYGLALMMMVAGAVTSSLELDQSLAHYDRMRNLAAREASLDSVIVVKRPSSLRFVHSDIDADLPDYLIVSPDFVDYPIENLALKRLARSALHLDWGFVTVNILSLLALLVTFDSVSGEHERGTLKLILSLGSSRATYLFGSLLGAVLTILPVALIGYAMNLLVILSNSQIRLSGHDWVRISLSVLISSVLIVLFAAIGTLTSTLSRRSSISLLLALSVWVLFIIVIPIGSVLLAEQLVTIPAATVVESEMQQARRRFFAESYLLSSGDLRDIYERTDFSEAERQQELSRLQEMVYQQDLVALARYHKRLTEIRESYLKSLLKQVELANVIARASPVSCYREVMSSITDTDLFYQRLFYDEARQYMLAYSEFVTPLREKLKSQAEINGVRIKDKGYEIRDLQAISWRNVEFDRGGLPRFEERVVAISAALELSIGGLGILSLTVVLVLALSYFRFGRYSLL